MLSREAKYGDGDQKDWTKKHRLVANCGYLFISCYRYDLLDELDNLILFERAYEHQHHHKNH